MKIWKIRKNVFETNSSSTHSISFGDWPSGPKGICTIDPSPEDNKIHIYTDRDFSWNWEGFNDPYTKAQYALAENKYEPDKIDLILEVIKDWTGFDVILDGDIDDLCIDHQSTGTLEAITKEDFKNFIFNPGVWLYTGNDNSDEPEDLYDQEVLFSDGEHCKVTIEFKDHDRLSNKKIETKTFLILGYPNNENLRKALNYVYIGDEGYNVESVNLVDNIVTLVNSWNASSEIIGKIIKIESDESGEIV